MKKMRILSCAVSLFAIAPLSQFSLAANVNAVEQCHIEHPVFESRSTDKESSVSDIDFFIQCLNEKADVNDARVLMVRGHAQTLAGFFDKKPGARYDLALEDYCQAAKLDYVYGQEECGSWQARYRPIEGYYWLKKAAFNGSNRAQHEISTGNFKKEVASESELQQDSYVMQYLSCHPAMFSQVCGFAEDVPLCKESRENDTDYFYSRIGQCHMELQTRTLSFADAISVEKWNEIARAQLAETLLNIQNQIKRFPNLSSDSRAAHK